MKNYEDNRLVSVEKAMLGARKLADDLEWAGKDGSAYRSMENNYKAMLEAGILYMPCF